MDCKMIYTFFVIEAYCILHNQKATFKVCKIISSKLWTLPVNYILCILLRSFKASCARMSLHDTDFQRKAVAEKKMSFYFFF